MSTNTVKKYRDTLLSILLVVSWFVIAYRIFQSSATNNRLLEDITLTYFINTGIGIVGGIVLIFLALLKKRKLRYSFVYNLFGTFNIITGLIGLALHGNTADPSPYIISACITVGVIMYCSIY